MAKCDCGTFEVDCPENCGCGCICDAGTDRCWSLCDCPDGPVIDGPEDAIVVGPPGFENALDARTEVKLCAKGIRLASLAKALNRYVKADIYVPAGRLQERLELTTYGTVADVLTECGLKVESKY